MKIRSKLTLSLLTVTLTSIACVSGLLFWLTYGSLIDARGQKLEAVASGQKSNVVHVINAWQDRVNLISSRTRLRKLMAILKSSPDADKVRSEIEVILSDALSADRALEYVELCDCEGNSLVFCGVSPGVNFSGSEGSAQFPLRTNLRTLKRDSKGNLHGVVTGPMLLNGKPIGFIYAVMSAKEITDVTNNYDGLGDSGETLLAERTANGDARFLLYLRHDPSRELSRIVKRDRLDVPITQALLRRESLMTSPDTVDYRDIPVLAATAYIPETDWGMVSKIDRKEALEPVRNLIMTVLETTAAVVFVAVIIGVFLARSIAAPIQELAVTAQKIRDGDLTRVSEIDSKDEIGELSRAFNAMLHSLEDQQNLFRLAMRNSPIGKALVSPDGKFLEVNKVLCEILGYKENELKNMTFQDLTHPEDLETDLENLNKLFRREIETYQMEKRYLHKNGDYIWGLLSVSLITNDDGSPRYLISQIQDISAKRLAEQNLLETNAELEEFAYRTSHDLRSPLVSSISLLEVVKNSVEEGDKALAIEGLEHTQSSLKKLEILVQDILLLTRTKNVEEEIVDVDLTQIVDDSLKKFSHMDNFQNLTIEKNLEVNPPTKLKKSRLSLIVENLISNAIKYQDPQKSNPFVRLSTYRDNGSFVFEVADNGLGVPTDKQEKLFHMFKRFHPKVSFGSGLGLYMMKKSADVLGGKIVFEDPGEGAIFRLNIPLTGED